MWGAAQRGFAALTRVGLLPTLGKENLAGARNNLGKHVFCLDFGVHLRYSQFSGRFSQSILGLRISISFASPRILSYAHRNL